ncbi:MAG: redox-regulated ATPase YchF [Deltaproteobacteria bacterium]|nr:redox-regulated ATPase YchF [Deltaproteobacteria bacterium]
MGFTCGIVGLPNVGKSTIFNALTSAKAAAANFPFCTIEPNTGAVPVPDPRLEILAKLAGSQKIIPTQITFVDIAGLIRGASKGEGLGNQFLGHIRSVDAIAHVVRCFEDSDVVHVDGKVDPLSDIETINTELVLADLDSVQKQIQKTEKIAKSGDKDAKARLDVLNSLERHLSSGKLAVNFQSNALPDVLIACTETLLTSKPVLYVLNVSEDEITAPMSIEGDSTIARVARYAKEHDSQCITISGKVESELAELTAGERDEFLQSLGLQSSGLDRLVIAGYKLLNLITFFTVGPKETHAWTAPFGTRAPQCAGKIHSDFERGFIRAEVISYTDFVSTGSEAKAREAGKLRVEGKEYVMQDGDIVHFRFNV